MADKTYEIHVRGELPQHLASDLGGLTSIEAPPETVLLTPLIDQAGLHDMLALLRDFGVELVEVRRTAEGDPAQRATPE